MIIIIKKIVTVLMSVLSVFASPFVGDFTAEKTVIYARLDLSITVGRLLSLGVRYGIRVLREFIRITKLRKGGAVK